MKLTDSLRAKLLNSSKAIYQAYTALHFSKEPLFKEGQSNKSLETIISEAINSGKFDDPLTIQDQNNSYQIQINQGPDNTYQIIFINQLLSDLKVEEHTKYNQGQKIEIMAGQKFRAKKDKKGNFSLGLELSLENNQSFNLGGPNKYDLYPEHLSTLFNIQKHIQKEGDVPSMLIALATGAGKTFVQAVWIMVLKHAGLAGIFAVPNQLVEQFKQDLKNLLPDEMVEEIKTIEENKPNKEGVKALESLKTKPEIIVASYEELLDRHYDTLNSFNEIALSFDEQHLVIEKEKREIQLTQLADKNLTMLLTATPNQKTYELCGKKPVAYMSSKQKADANHGLFPNLEFVEATNLDDRDKMVSDNQISLLDQMHLGFANSFLEQRTSPILDLFEKFQFDNKAYHFKKLAPEGDENFHKLRWTYQPPTSRKMLCIVDNNEELINLNNAINKTDEWGDQKQFKIKIMD